MTNKTNNKSNSEATTDQQPLRTPKVSGFAGNDANNLKKADAFATETNVFIKKVCNKTGKASFDFTQDDSKMKSWYNKMRKAVTNVTKAINKKIKADAFIPETSAFMTRTTNKMAL